MRKHFLPLSLLFVVTLAAGVFITWNGVNHHYDAAWYLVYARGVALGEGFRVPITSVTNPDLTATINQWPPFYPLLFVPGAAWDLYAWGRVVTIALFIGAAALTYALGWVATDGNRTAATIAALLAITVPAMGYDGFSFVRSETLFAVGGLGMLLLLAPYRVGRTDVPVKWALWAAALAALMTLTRYVAVSLVAIGGLWAFLWGIRAGGHPRRWWPTVAYVLSVVPLGLYALYLRSATGSFTGTQTTADPFTLSGIPRGVRTIVKETLHGLSFPFGLAGLRSDWWALVAAGLLVLVLAGIIWRRGHTLGKLWNSQHALMAVYVGGYCAVFWAMGARADIITEETARHYVAVFPVIMVLIVSAATRIPAPRALWGGVVALYLVSGVVAMGVPAAGLYYNRPDWRTDPLLADLPNWTDANTLLHTQYTSHLSMIVGPDVPVRTFGTVEAFRDNACDTLQYPEPATHAVFTLIDGAYLRETPPDEVEAFMRGWAAPCGEVERYANNGFALLVRVRLGG
jgi:hypothetical protein